MIQLYRMKLKIKYTDRAGNTMTATLNGLEKTLAELQEISKRSFPAAKPEEVIVTCGD